MIFSTNLAMKTSRAPSLESSCNSSPRLRFERNNKTTHLLSQEQTDVLIFLYKNTKFKRKKKEKLPREFPNWKFKTGNYTYIDFVP